MTELESLTFQVPFKSDAWVSSGSSGVGVGVLSSSSLQENDISEIRKINNNF